MTNMTAEAFQIETPDEHRIHGTIWLPSGNVRGVVQLFHGLGEHHARYERFAESATARGLVLVAHDHRGHGAHSTHLGHFSDRNGWQHLIDDGLRVNDMIRERFDKPPVVLVGHSMGSYVAEHFAMFHYDRIGAMVLSASTWPSRIQVFFGQLLARIEALRLGRRGNSALLDKLGFGSFNRRFAPVRTPLDWLTRDPDEVDIYIADPLCGGPYSCGLWIDVMGGLMTLASDNELSRIRSDLPILLTAGSDDPVGGEKGIEKLALHYAQSMHERLTVKLYPGGRHEMFNETNRDEFTNDLLNWIDARLPAIAGRQT